MTIEEIHSIIKNNKNFMQTSVKSANKIGFKNPLFNGMDLSHIEESLRLNFEKMRNPKKYRSKPLHQ